MTDPTVLRQKAPLAQSDAPLVATVVHNAEEHLANAQSVVITGDVALVQQITISGGVLQGDIIGTQTIVTLPPEGEGVDLMAAHALLASMPIDYPPDIAPLPTGSHMPMRRNPLFTGRTSDLAQLSTMILADGAAVIGQIAVATGLGGIGKTQLAAEFAHRYGQYFVGGVFWIDCSDQERAADSVAICGGPEGMNIPGWAGSDQAAQIALVQRAWRRPIPRLLIFDNCEDEATLLAWRPVTGGCRLLVTSRRARWDQSLGALTLALDVLPRAESIALLSQFLPDLHDAAALDAVADAVGDLPLALHLAGSYLRRYQYTVTPQEYIAQLSAAPTLEHRSLQGWQLSAQVSPTHHDQHVGRTFAVSYAKLSPTDKVDALARALLARAARLAPGAQIPRALLVATIADGVSDEFLLSDALYRIAELGLLSTQQHGTQGMHRLLSSFVLELEPEAATDVEVHNAILGCIRQLHAANQTPEPELRPHLRHGVAQAFARALALERYEEAAEFILGLDSFMLAWGEARQVAERHQHLLPHLQPDRVRLACLINLGIALSQLGDYEQMLLCQEQALSIARELPDRYLESVVGGNIGTYYHYIGQLDEACARYEVALSAAREARQNSATQSLQVKWLSNLCECWNTRGHVGKALDGYQQAVETAQMLGDQQLAAEVFAGLAKCHELIGDTKAAVLAYEEGLAGARAVGNRWLEGSCLEGLGIVALMCGDHDAAAKAFTQSLSLWQSMGIAAWQASLMHDEAELLIDQRRWSEAAVCAREAIDLSIASGVPLVTRYAYGALASSMLFLGDLDAARAAADAACQQNVEEHEFYVRTLQGVIALRIGEEADDLFLCALAVLDVLLEREPRLVRARAMRIVASCGLALCDPSRDLTTAIADVERLALLPAATSNLRRVAMLVGSLTALAPSNRLDKLAMALAPWGGAAPAAMPK